VTDRPAGDGTGLHAADGVLEATAGMPERRLEPGEVLFGEGDDREATVAVLVDGTLQVELGDNHLSDIRVPGAFVGEVAALLATGRTATVRATTASTVRVIGDPAAFFATHPEIGLELARQLAGRLHRLLAYLGDLRTQYADDQEQVTLVDSVLGRLASRPTVDIEPGSDRSPDY
jgi:CRP-like cAMP-binding protein